MAKWKTELDREESHVGFLKIGGDWTLNFPILPSPNDIAPSTTLIWGLADNLKKCTVLTLPFGPPGSTYRVLPGEPPTVGECLYNAVGRATHVLVGDTYIGKPADNFIREMSFVPQPNRILHEQTRFRFIQPARDIAEINFAESCEPEKKAIASASLAYFEPNRGALLETAIASLGGRLAIHFVAARTRRSEREGALTVSVRFNEVRGLHTAIEQAYIVCVFLSFICHQHVTPTGLRVVSDRSGETHELHFRTAKRGAGNPGAWVGYTLVLPDKDPAAFGETVPPKYSDSSVMI